MDPWCELRKGYRHFRIDRIETLTITDTRFETSTGKYLERYITLHAPEALKYSLLHDHR
ncbi:WYL domain-containing protein [Vibrio sp. Hep-1b-8]|uniref:WYL domain-containing protein n=1 Tax=Vibrio sp. Hep-1b-8 TaxID=2144187 RepID=UPI003211E5BD